MTGAAIVLDRETANDESGTVVAVHVPSGATVAEDELIFDIENSKATQELRAPQAGVLHHTLEVGSIVAFGVPIASIAPVAEGDGGSPHLVPPDNSAADDGGRSDVPRPTAGAAPACDTVPETPAGTVGRVVAVRPWFSHAALALIERHDLATSRFTSGFITVADVNELLASTCHDKASSPRPGQQERSETIVTSKAGTAVSGSKRVEIDVLESGASRGMLSVLGATVGPLRVRRADDSFLCDRITDLVIYETARLMRKYPKLNAYYADNRVVLHDEVHAGLAIDAGGRLVVYGIDNSDRKSLTELSHHMAEAVRRYVSGELTIAEMSRATFTVTDLSADELDFVFPLLPRGQSCIVGITRSEQTGFRVFAGFDHRVTEGREVAAFLRELRGRLLSYSHNDPQEVASIRCEYCERSAAELGQKNKDRGLLRVVDRHGKDVLCCASCWNGW